MEENYAPSQNESKKETKGFVTRLSHKIKKTIGLTSSNKPDILLDNPLSAQINRKPESRLPTIITRVNNDTAHIAKLIRSEKKSNLFEEECIPCKKDKYKASNSDSDTDSDTDLDTKVHFRNIQAQVQEVQSANCHGPTGPFSNTVICLNRDTEQLLAKDAAILWTLNPIKAGDIANITNTSEIFIWKPGFYIVYYNICSPQSCKFSLFKNGDIVSGSTTNYTVGSAQNSVRLIMVVNKSDLSFPTSLSPIGFATKIEVVNHTQTIPNVRLMSLNTMDMGTSTQMVATISISLLSAI